MVRSEPHFIFTLGFFCLFFLNIFSPVYSTRKTFWISNFRSGKNVISNFHTRFFLLAVNCQGAYRMPFCCIYIMKTCFLLIFSAFSPFFFFPHKKMTSCWAFLRFLLVANIWTLDASSVFPIWQSRCCFCSVACKNCSSTMNLSETFAFCCLSLLVQMFAEISVQKTTFYLMFFFPSPTIGSVTLNPLFFGRGAGGDVIGEVVVGCSAGERLVSK